jgi:hypothetical protein
MNRVGRLLELVRQYLPGYQEPEDAPLDEIAGALVGRLSRRGFLTAMAAIPVAAALPEHLVEALAPSRRIFLPAAPVIIDYSAELAAVVRRAFVPRLITQLYASSPLMAQLIKQRQHEEWASMDRNLNGLFAPRS